ncbi:unnamed protein product [Phytophthora fragariaefolia]|uniref:Unnamed protein product n=1 Tax=Phytophthora fragariaefolia TaxID=1490495 RepID=A0A9W6X8G0_9STRA|nr:unnamed protein product [Phytophthora fragariaefolia]
MRSSPATWPSTPVSRYPHLKQRLATDPPTYCQLSQHQNDDDFDGDGKRESNLHSIKLEYCDSAKKLLKMAKLTWQTCTTWDPRSKTSKSVILFI